MTTLAAVAAAELAAKREQTPQSDLDRDLRDLVAAVARVFTTRADRERAS